MARTAVTVERPAICTQTVLQGGFPPFTDDAAAGDERSIVATDPQGAACGVVGPKNHPLQEKLT